MWKKFLKRFQCSLTARIFLITSLILAAACCATYIFLAWAMPISYVAVVSSDLENKTGQLVEELAQVKKDSSGPLIDRFTIDTGASVIIQDVNGNAVDTGATIQIQYDSESSDALSLENKSNTEDITVRVSDTALDSEEFVETPSHLDSVEFAETPLHSRSADFAETPPHSRSADFEQEFSSSVMSSVLTSEVRQAYSFSFLDNSAVYTLTVSPSVTAVNQASQALLRVLPLMVLVVLLISLLGAVIYSLYITRPIVRISGISQRIAQLDFSWKCGETRSDEIGMLGRNLDELSHRLSTALNSLQDANEGLRRDIDFERELERQRLAFFSAVSHELKTPITILKGQITGMLEGVGIYNDRDKYLAKALNVTGRMEGLVQEILTVSRMESNDFELDLQAVDLNALVKQQLALDEDLIVEKELEPVISLSDNAIIFADKTLLMKALDNIISNAIFYGPEKARLEIAVARDGDIVTLSVENSGSSIPEDALPHVFEAFYRADSSRNSRTGGSGLGLYIVKMILDRHDVFYRIENTPGGVLFTIQFQG